MDIIIIIFSLFVLSLVFNFSTWISGKIIGLKLDEFSVGVGPNIYKHSFGNSTLLIRILPCGGSINFYMQSENGIELMEIHKLKSIQKILLAIIAPIFQIAIGAIILEISATHFSNIIAILSILIGLFSLMPIPSQNGFILITAVFPSLKNKPIDKILPPAIQTLSIVTCLILYYGFLIYFMVCTDTVLKAFNLSIFVNNPLSL